MLLLRVVDARKINKGKNSLYSQLTLNGAILTTYDRSVEYVY